MVLVAMLHYWVSTSLCNMESIFWRHARTVVDERAATKT